MTKSLRRSHLKKRRIVLCGYVRIINQIGEHKRFSAFKRLERRRVKESYRTVGKLRIKEENVLHGLVFRKAVTDLAVSKLF